METKRKLRQTIKALDNSLRLLARRLESVEKQVRTSARPGEALISLPVVDTAGEVVLATRQRGCLTFGSRRYPATRDISLVRFVRELEEDTGMQICWSQNDEQVVVYERDAE